MSGLKYTLVVNHPESLTPVALLVGEPVPSWAEGMVRADDYEDSSEAPAAVQGQPDIGDGGEDQPEPYKGVTIPQLKAEIEKRNESRSEGELIPSDGNRPDLVAALVADDSK
ncbi:hypothetical protein GCM10009616_35810 [Microlunatus lacustris]